MKAELHLPISGAAEGLGLTPDIALGGPYAWSLQHALEAYAARLMDALAKVHRFSLGPVGGDAGMSVAATLEDGEVKVEGPEEMIEELRRAGVLCPADPDEADEGVFRLPISGAAEGLGLRDDPDPFVGGDNLKMALDAYVMQLIAAAGKVHHFSIATHGADGPEGVSATLEDGVVTIEGPDEEIERLIRIGVLCPAHSDGECDDYDDEGDGPDGPDDDDDGAPPALKAFAPSVN
jgi:hypothetical protein